MIVGGVLRYEMLTFSMCCRINRRIGEVRVSK